MCKVLIEEYKADVNLSDINGITPLHIASYVGHLEI
jgi:ankyrin repeat protein